MSADRERATGAPCSARSAPAVHADDLSTRSLTPEQLPPAPAVPPPAPRQLPHTPPRFHLRYSPNEPCVDCGAIGTEPCE